MPASASGARASTPRSFQLLKNVLLFSPVGFKENRSLVKICYFFRRLEQHGRKKSLFLRTELNAWVGMTKDTFLGPNAGLRAYQAPKEKTEEKAKFYYLNEKGVQKSVDADDIMMHTPRHEQMSLQVPGQAATVLARPDRELMALIDAMLGEASCMGKASLGESTGSQMWFWFALAQTFSGFGTPEDSKCAFRCFYDVEHEVCGPVAFCQPVASGAASHVLAPFGDQQKCAAVGGRTHDVADQATCGQ